MTSAPKAALCNDAGDHHDVAASGFSGRMSYSGPPKANTATALPSSRIDQSIDSTPIIVNDMPLLSAMSSMVPVRNEMTHNAAPTTNNPTAVLISRATTTPTAVLTARQAITASAAASGDSACITLGDITPLGEIMCGAAAAPAQPVSPTPARSTAYRAGPCSRSLMAIVVSATGAADNSPPCII
jgi:hypothetical protein